MTRLKIKCLRYDRGGEFTFGEFNTFCEEHGLKRKLSTPISSYKNGFVERNKTIV